MDVIAPQLLWIEGRCYRVNPSVEIADNNGLTEYIGAGFESLQV